ncbi:Crp/Fnr family transcriptional regulator [Granulosicoccaceae sp. 1_MG-2023]|nr:Crp/Fnr family transcriptional regulator [Granulosicoccaceae sp. 1_MG-2023]
MDSLRNNTPLDHINVLKVLPEYERRSLANEEVVLRHYRRGDIVAEPGTPARAVFFIISGKVRHQAYSSDGKAVHYGFDGCGGLFGEVEAIEDSPRTLESSAFCDSTIGLLPAARFRDLCEKYPAVEHALRALLVQRLETQMRRVFEFTTLSVRERVRREIVRIAEAQFRSAQDSTAETLTIHEPPTHAEIAACISSHREAVTREIKSLEAEGVIVWKRGCYQVRDFPRLRELAS